MFFYKAKKKEQTDELHKEYGVISNCGYILRAFRKYRPSVIAYLVLGGITGASMSYIWSFIGKLVIDMIERQAAAGSQDIKPLLYLIIATTVVEFVMMWLNALVVKNSDLGFTYTRMKITTERIAKSMRMEYEQLETPDMLDRLQKAKRATGFQHGGVQGLMYDMQTFMISITSVATAIGIICTLDIRLVLIILVLSLIQFEYFDYIRIKDKEVMWDAMAGVWRRLDYMQTVSTDFSYAKDIRLYGMKNWLNKKHEEVNKEELARWVLSRTYWQYNTLFSGGIALVRNVIVYAWMIYGVLFDGMSIGDFTLYVASATAMSQAISSFLQAVGGMRERSSRMDDFRTFMDIPFGVEGRKTIRLPKADIYTFEFRIVSFRYQGQEGYALRNLNLTLAAGERLAVVGLNGAGKTTFIKLLLRLYDVTEGEILCNGTDIRKFDRNEYFALFAPAFQEVEVFAFPLSENISMTAAELTDKDKAEEYIRAAGMGDKLDKLPNGMDTELLKVLYDDGVDLSGGEKQKLALARALYKNAPVVVLDEPTAALDALAEYRLYQSFNGMIGERSAVYISHRLSSTRFCDSIAMFVKGEMVEHGTHDELLAKGGAYSDMFHVQAQYYIEDSEDSRPKNAAEGGVLCE